MSGRRGISRLGPEARRERARKAARARWARARGGWEAEARVGAEGLLVLIRGRPGSELHVRRLERLLEWLGGGAGVS